jgi:xylan 1,4-beta-xylosidase
MRLARFTLGVGLELAFFAASCWAQPSFERVVIDAGAPGRPFPHFWEQTFGSGRAILTLRESYRSDLREVKRVTEFSYVRFHNILHDEVGVYDEDDTGNAIYNFSYSHYPRALSDARLNRTRKQFESLLPKTPAPNG